MATTCFERPGDVFREQLSRASGLRASADCIIHSNSEAGRHLLTEAAEIYENIGKVELAASCYIELRNFERAGTIYLENCGESRLQDAGDCFSQAKCWLLAANAYAKGNCYSKCLSVCSSGNLFDEGLHYIENWRGCRTSEPSAIVEECKSDWEEIEFPFLERCARRYHELKDLKRMMKFVNAFNAINKARGFLMPRGYLDELLSMEEELGNFMEAAKLAKMKGDILLQADMLEKAGQFEASFRLVLFYIVANSLWTTGTNGWPLKTFKRKDELLKRAKLLAEKSSESSFESMNVEISILEDKEKSLVDLVKILNAARRLEIVMGQVFAARKILDIHIKSDPSKFHQESVLDGNPEKQASKMQRNLLSSETLLFVWNIWKEKICGILDSLGNFDELSEDGSSRLQEFCIDYFGLQRNKERNYIVHHPDASFLRDGGHRSFKKDGKLSLIESDQFVSAAKSYWISELLSVGMEVLRRLQEVRRFCRKETLWSACEGVAVLRIFQLSKFLINFRLAYKKSDSKPLLDSSAESKRCFFDLVFPLDWRLVLNESVITLRETDLAKELLKEVLVDSIKDKEKDLAKELLKEVIVDSSKDRLTYGEIGRIAMIILVTGNLDDQLYETVLNHLPERSPWKKFIEQLRNKEPGCRQQVLVASSLRDALKGTFDIDWQNEVGYITPPSFLYLLERFLFTVSAQQHYFFTTKSSFVEALASDSCCFQADAYGHIFFAESVNFFAYLIPQILFNQPGTTEWIMKSKLTAVRYYPLLVLKLIVMIAVVYMNSGQLLNMLVDALKYGNIISVLPKEFYGHLRGVAERNFHDKFAAALVTIGDPLVMVRLTCDFPNVASPSCLSIDMSIKQSREDTMNILFPKKSPVSHESEPRREPEASEDTCSSSDINVCGCEINLASDLETCKESTATIDDGKGCDLQGGYDHICSTLDDLLLEHGRGSSNYETVAAELKAEAEKFLAILDGEVSIFEQSTAPSEDGWLEEAKSLFDELIKLANVLHGRKDGRVKDVLPALGEILDRLRRSRPRFEPLFSLPSKKDVCASEEKPVAAATAAAAADVSVKKGVGNKGTSSKPKQQKKNRKGGRKGRR